MILALTCMFALFLLFGLWRTTVRTRELSLPTWQELAARLQPVPREAIRELAMEHLEPGTAGFARGHIETWDMLGGVEGLKRMKENADVLIALASYAQRWNRDESVIVAERMRRDCQTLRRAVVGMGIGLTLGYGQARVLAYVHEAASSYHLMRERLLALYKSSHAGIYPALVDSV